MTDDRRWAGARGTRWRWVLWALAAFMAAQGVGKTAVGTVRSWRDGLDQDLQSRAAEYAVFREGGYPHDQIERAADRTKAVHSVYPPYAFPMLAVFFEPAGLVQGRAVVWLLSIASLAWIGFYAFGVLRPDGGVALATVGALTAFATTRNTNVFGLGQFAILCVGLIVGQMALLARGRPVAAGACWALAMLKPHVALPFGLLFLLRGQWRGGVAGIAILAALSWGACAWTDVSPLRVVDFWLHGMSFDFSEEGFGVGPGSLAAQLGLEHRVVQFLLLGAMGGAALAVALLLRRFGTGAILPVAALASAIGFLGFYHRLYDMIMLFPLVLAMLATAASTRRPLAAAIAALAVLSMLVPREVLDGRYFPQGAFAALWGVAAAYPLIAFIAAERRAKSEAA